MSFCHLLRTPQYLTFFEEQLASTDSFDSLDTIAMYKKMPPLLKLGLNMG